jgi:hypothetical protein
MRPSSEMPACSTRYPVSRPYNHKELRGRAWNPGLYGTAVIATACTGSDPVAAVV